MPLLGDSLLYFSLPTILEIAARKKTAENAHKNLSKNMLTSIVRIRVERVTMTERMDKGFLLGSRKDLFG